MTVQKSTLLPERQLEQLRTWRKWTEGRRGAGATVELLPLMATTLPAATEPRTENAASQLARLLRYLFSYLWQFLPAVVLMAMVGLLDAFRLLLIGPIFDRVLNPGAPGRP